MDLTAEREWREFMREERAAIQKLDDEKDQAYLDQIRREAEEEGE